MAENFKALDPEWERKIRASFKRQGFMNYLHAEIVQAVPGSLTIEVPFRPELTQQHGFFHAGVVGAIADTAGGYAGFSLFPPDSTVLTVEFKINLLSPAKGDRLQALAKVVKPGRTLTVCDLKVHVMNGARTVLCACGQQTLICLAGKPDQ